MFDSIYLFVFRIVIFFFFVLIIYERGKGAVILEVDVVVFIRVFVCFFVVIQVGGSIEIFQFYRVLFRVQVITLVVVIFFINKMYVWQ